MNPQSPSPAVFPFRLESPTGLSIELNANGSIRRMDHRDILLNLFLGTEIEGGLANLYLRRVGGVVEATPLFGPRSPAAIHVDQGGMTAQGEWKGRLQEDGFLRQEPRNEQAPRDLAGRRPIQVFLGSAMTFRMTFTIQIGRKGVGHAPCVQP